MEAFDKADISTTDENGQQESTDSAQGLIEQIKDALEHLYDLSYLERHPLAERWSGTDLSPEMAGQRLRRELLTAIELLSPGPGIPFCAPQARAYHLLIMHYVEGMTVQEAAYKLGISRRQAHRDLGKAIEKVIAILSARHSTLALQEPSVVQLSSIQAEVARLESRLRSIDIRMLLQRIQEMTTPLATQRQVRLRTDFPQDPVILLTDPVIAEQVFVSILSHTIRQAFPGDLHLRLIAGEKCITFSLRYLPERRVIPIDLALARLIERLEWRVEQKDQPDGFRIITLIMPRSRAVVLVIDDNEGLVTLIKRYLTGHTYRVVPAANGLEGLRLAQELLPDAIVLDVIMSEMSGWEVLRRLRNYSKTAKIPVIICSVLNNPELAYSLGASLFLPKPISREDVLNALHKLGVM